MVVGIPVTSTHAQTDYENAFCSAYEYSVECYEHRYKVSGKVKKFVAAMEVSLAQSSDQDALIRLRNIDDQLGAAVSKYDGTHRVNLIHYLRDEMGVLLADYTDRVTRLTLTQADLERLSSYSTDKQ
jgi:hypothetical protein